jgi:hypothetical protein
MAQFGGEKDAGSDECEMIGDSLIDRHACSRHNFLKGITEN